MIKVANLIELFHIMYEEHWKYVWGAAQYGCVDCSGAFSYAFHVSGYSISHGSNSIARKHIVGDLLPISEARPGMAAFKVREWKETQRGNTWYGSSPGDLYHVGLVDDDTRYVLNAKGERYGFSRDEISKGWGYVAYLKNVDYGEQTNGGTHKVVTAKVILPAGKSGSTVNLRASKSTRSDLVDRIEVGTVVAVLEDQGEWCKIQVGSKTGWMLSNFLEYDVPNADGEIDSQVGGTGVLTSDDLAEIDQALKAIEKACDLIGGIVGRG